MSFEISNAPRSCMRCFNWVRAKYPCDFRWHVQRGFLTVPIRCDNSIISGNGNGLFIVVQKRRSTSTFNSALIKEASVSGAGRFMTVLERVRHFPRGVRQIYQDCLLYKNILDVSRNPRSAWSLNNNQRRKDRILYQESSIPGRIPRRQFEQQRRLIHDLHVVLPLVLSWLVPIVGYLAVVGAVVAPRQVLTRQFINEYELWDFAVKEDWQRRQYYKTVSELFWNATTSKSEPPDQLQILGVDRCGPFFNPQFLYSNRPDNQFARFLKSTYDLPDKYLVPLALATGSFQNMPPQTASVLTRWFTPRRFLRYRVRREARSITIDDALLIEESAHLSQCCDLTDQEILDACLLRGLPILDDHDEMRKCLTHHLHIIALVHEEARKEQIAASASEKDCTSYEYRYTESLGLISLHLPILRRCLPIPVHSNLTVG